MTLKSRPRSLPTTIISAKILALSGGLNATGHATYTRLGVGSVEAKVLWTLDRPRPAAAISDELSIDRAAVSRAVQTLEAQGLIVRPGNSRIIALTRDGDNLRERIRGIHALRTETLMRGLSDAEVDELDHLLMRLADNISKLKTLADSAPNGSVANIP